MSVACAAALGVSVFVWFAIYLALFLSHSPPHALQTHPQSLWFYTASKNPPHIISSHHCEPSLLLDHVLVNSLQSVHWEFWECPARELGILGVSEGKLKILYGEKIWNSWSVQIENWDFLECLEKELGILWPPREGALLGAPGKSSGHAGAKYSGLQQCLVLLWLLEWANGGR